MHTNDSDGTSTRQSWKTRRTTFNAAQTRLMATLKSEPKKLQDGSAFREFAAARTREDFHGRGVRQFWNPFEERLFRRQTEDFLLQLCTEAEDALMAAGAAPLSPTPPQGYYAIFNWGEIEATMGPDGQCGPPRTPEQSAAIKKYESDLRLHLHSMRAHRTSIAEHVRAGVLDETAKHPSAEAERAAESDIQRAAVGEVQGLPEGGDRGADLLDGDTPDVDWLVDGLLPASGLMLIAGRPKGGKSTLLYQMMYCVTTGLPFLDSQVKEPVQAALISADDPNKTRVRRRFQTVRLLMPGADEPAVQAAFKAHMIEAYYEWPAGERFLPALDKLTREHPDLKLVVVDAYANIKKTQKSVGADRKLTHQGR